MAHRRHAVLAAVSRGYPPPNDKSLRVPHPSATARARKPQPCDLHVLSMPPAFALSQDQTLRFIMAHQPRRNAQNTPPKPTRHHQQKAQFQPNQPSSQTNQHQPTSSKDTASQHPIMAKPNRSAQRNQTQRPNPTQTKPSQPTTNHHIPQSNSTQAVKPTHMA